MGMYGVRMLPLLQAGEGGDVSMTRRHPDDPEGRPLCRQSSDPLAHGSCRHSCDHGQQHRSTSYAAEATKYTDTFALIQSERPSGKLTSEQPRIFFTVLSNQHL